MFTDQPLRDQALEQLLHTLDQRGYDFVTVTPATHAAYLGRRPGRLAENLRDVLGWSLPFREGSIDPEIERLLEEAGVIDRYVALVRPESVGLGLIAYINVRLEKQSETHKRNPMDVFRASVQAWPEVVECAALTGEMDFLLRVVVQDMAHYSRFIMDTLLKHPSVQDCKTSFVLDSVKATTAVPI